MDRRRFISSTVAASAGLAFDLHNAHAARSSSFSADTDERRQHRRSIRGVGSHIPAFPICFVIGPGLFLLL